MEGIIDTLTNTELAILGLVAERPKHGYQIEQDIATRGFREWTEIGFSSIYYVLNKLETAGWLASERGQDAAARRRTIKASSFEAAEIEASPEQPERRAGPARRVYHLTDAGQAGYRAAVRERLAHPRPRSGDFDLALANLPALRPEEARTALETYRAALQQRLEQVRAKWEQDRAAAEIRSLHPGPFPAHVDALFGHSISGIEAELHWLESFLSGFATSSRTASLPNYRITGHE